MSRHTEATDDVNTWSGGHINYKEGFFTQLQTDEMAKGINEEVIRAISARRNEPEWMLEYRLKAHETFYVKPMPQWGGDLGDLDFDEITYYVKPSEATQKSWDEDRH